MPQKIYDKFQRNSFKITKYSVI